MIGLDAPPNHLFVDEEGVGREPISNTGGDEQIPWKDMEGVRRKDRSTGIGKEVKGGIEGGKPGEKRRVVLEAKRKDKSMKLVALGEGSLGGGAGEKAREGEGEEKRGGAEAEKGEDGEGLGKVALGGEGFDGVYEGVKGMRAEPHHVGQLFANSSRTRRLESCQRSCTRMALLDQKIVQHPEVAKSSGVLAYDLLQGSLVEWNSFMDKSVPDPPTAVLLHGILGGRKNWADLTDIFCLKQVAQLRVTPRVLVGHSFGGKVALSMVEQAAKPLARPVRVWVLDATPGKVRPGGDGEDHPGELISFLSSMPQRVSSKHEVVNALVREGFSTDVARWVVTNLQPVSQPGPSSSPGFSWIFDLKGIAEMYKSYEETILWETVENVPRGVHVNFLKAERSLHRWALEDLQRIHAAEELAADEGAGVEMHVLEDAGHWVCYLAYFVALYIVPSSNPLLLLLLGVGGHAMKNTNWQKKIILLSAFSSSFR
ncbi:putative protein ABHD11 [Cocos nucifera]|uniref:AB hydrolase-1 domain-containing protein n=1 Tax=Cocos nucifera TaxID=13894 RepID=A0A8K0HX28_COCNU|nr:putative protein ABHD11 [Cocos nucifera]